MGEDLSVHSLEWNKGLAISKEGRQWQALLKKATGQKGQVRIDIPNTRFIIEGKVLRRYVFRIPFEVGKASDSEKIEYDFAVFESHRADRRGWIDWTVHRNWEKLSCRENREEMSTCLKLAKALARTLPLDNPEASSAAEMWGRAELY